MQGDSLASNAVTALAAESDLADVNRHLLSILNSLDRAIVEGTPGSHLDPIGDERKLSIPKNLMPEVFSKTGQGVSFSAYNL